MTNHLSKSMSFVRHVFTTTKAYMCKPLDNKKLQEIQSLERSLLRIFCSRGSLVFLGID